MWPRFWRDRAAGNRRGPRVLLYSHDTYGLGHLRRSRAIAITLTEAFPEASIIIVTGSPVVGRFDFPRGVDYVRMPGVVKLPSGEYATHNLSLDITETTVLRQKLIQSTVESFEPDLIVVDKEPSGFRGEILPTLALARSRRTRLVLGLRDVLDDPAALRQEWDRKQAMAAIEEFYDDIWVYGLREIYDPLDGLSLSQKQRRKIRFTGYLRREPPDWPDPAVALEREPYILITAGGGGDGDWLMDWVLSAYEADQTLDTPAVMVFGPFMNVDRAREFHGRAARHPVIETMSFDSRLERLMTEATGVVAMGGYNTFCEVLSFDKPAVIAPRTSPRLEQFIRASAAERLRLVRMPSGFKPGDDLDAAKRDPMVMAAAIRGLAAQPKPSAARVPGLLDGLDEVVRLAATSLSRLQAAE